MEPRRRDEAYEAGYRAGVEDERKRWQAMMERFSEFPSEGVTVAAVKRVAAIGADDAGNSRTAATVTLKVR